MRSSSTVLVFLGFPFPAVSLWRGGACLIWKTAPRSTPRTEKILPNLIKQVLEQVPLPGGCCTISGPGPFTALRSAKALLEGLSLGWPKVLCTSFSLLELGENLPQAIPKTLWIVPCGANTYPGVIWTPEKDPQDLSLSSSQVQWYKTSAPKDLVVHILSPEDSEDDVLRFLSCHMANRAARSL